MKSWLLAVSIPCALLTGCLADGDHDGTSGHHRATLPRDAYYLGVPLPFRTVMDCAADGTDPAACTHQVALCASGTYGVLHGDVVVTGRYRLDDHHAVNLRGRHGDDDDDDHDNEDDDDDGDDDDDRDDGEHAGGSAGAHFDFDVEAGQLVSDPANAGAIAWMPDVDGRWKASVVVCPARPTRE